jgi:hypothetical protein
VLKGDTESKKAKKALTRIDDFTIKNYKSFDIEIKK